MNELQIVVARYNEDIEWLRPLFPYCIIYNKGNDIPLEDKPNLIVKRLPNLGRESDTYLNYILENYSNLPDVVVFTQGNISDHRVGGANHLASLYHEAKAKGKCSPLNIEEMPYNFNVLCKSNPCVPQNYKNGEDLFGEWFEKHIHSKYPVPMKLWSNAIFAVGKELILKHPLDYYKRLLEQCNYHHSPIEAHYFERSWYYIFDTNSEGDIECRIQDADYIVVGGGLTGAVLSEQIANKLKKKVLILEKRKHIGGNCYDWLDKETGIYVNEYGPHFFHTNDEEVWNYVNLFSQWQHYNHRSVADCSNKLVPLPININTINTLFDANLASGDEMKEWIESQKLPISNIQTSEDYCLGTFGQKIYETLFKVYTEKQWGRAPSDLSASVCARIPLRYNFDDRYFTDKYQAIPTHGYTHFIQTMIDSPRITVSLNADYFQYEDCIKRTKAIVIFTGPIDHYYRSSGLPSLEYRSIDFTKQILYNTKYHQRYTIVTHPHNATPYTRTVEYKHIRNTDSPHTIIVHEQSKSDGEPYYPVPNSRNQALFQKYKELAENDKNVHFVGRLANYKYFNMDEAIKNALVYFRENLIQDCNT